MNVVILRGTLSSAPVLRTLASGSTLLSMELTTADGHGSASVPVAWFEPPTRPPFEIGDEVVVHGSVRRRFFRTAAGTQSRTEVVAVEVIAAARRRQVARLISRVAAELAGSGDVSRAC